MTYAPTACCPPVALRVLCRSSSRYVEHCWYITNRRICILMESVGFQRFHWFRLTRNMESFSCLKYIHFGAISCVVGSTYQFQLLARCASDEPAHSFLFLWAWKRDWDLQNPWSCRKWILTFVVKMEYILCYCPRNVKELQFGVCWSNGSV